MDKYYKTALEKLIKLENPDDPVHVGWGFWMFATSETDWIVEHN